jgi:O-antigen ligase
MKRQRIFPWWSDDAVPFANNFPFKLSSLLPSFRVIGITLYLVGFAFPWTCDFPLLVLAICGFLAAVSLVLSGSTIRVPLFGPICLFLLATGLSALSSKDGGRSIRLSAPLVPALLLFLLIATAEGGTRTARWLYTVFSAVALGLASAMISVAVRNNASDPSSWILAVGSPLLLVPNDVTFLAVVTPFSLVLFFQTPRSVAGILAGLSLLCSISAIVLLQSRVAILTVVLSVVFTVFLLRPRHWLKWGSAVGLLALALDWTLGFPLLCKFGRMQEARIALWNAAWTMFLDAPIMGHGPHTFASLHRKYIPTLSLPPWLPVDTKMVPWAHNLYLEVLAEQGLVGFAAFGLLLMRGLARGWGTQRGPPGERRALGVGALAGLCGFCFAAMIELSLLRQWVSIILFSLLGIISQLYPPQESNVDSKEE